ncbi:MAG TPA: aminoglycoside adenylyltransferase domain-containing protein [Pyrinomonadaceae bacterium]
MPARPAHPTPYADVNAVLHALLAGARKILGDRFAGLYLYGSLASGDFDPELSDIDFLVVTEGEMPDELLPALEAMHAGLASADRKWATKLEGSYVPRHALRRYDAADPPCPQLNEGRFYVARHCSDWIIQRHVLREHGVALSGPPPSTLIDPVSPDDLREAVRGILREWWEPMLLDGAWLRRGDLYQAYAVLTMCRALYTLRHGRIASKPVSAAWAQDELGARWATLIERASAWRHDAPSGDLSGATDFVRFTLGRARSSESSEATV